ncbi:MAG: hypothetical protein HYZ28_22075 [Myxococcales bacterium]|nr:hypothetical protein [Myxococcales bacterium]
MSTKIRREVSARVSPPKARAPKATATAKPDAGRAAAAKKDSFAKASVQTSQAPVIAGKAGQLGTRRTSWFDTLSRAADRLGGALRQGGRLVESAARALDGKLPLAPAVREVGRSARALGRTVADSPERTVAAAGQVAAQATKIGQDGLRLLGEAQRLTNPLVDGTQRALQTLGRGAAGIADAAKEFAGQVLSAADYRRNIDALGKGDKYTLGLGGSASAEGVKLYGKGQIEVARGDDGKYTVSVDGELGGGLYGELGGKAGAKASAEASALLGVGGKVEMKFDTAEEAKRATEILLRQAAVSAIQSSPVGAAVGPVVQATVAPSAEEMRFLTSKVSAVELRGNAAAELAGTLGVREQGIATAGLFGSAKVKGEVAARIELSPGKPPEVVIKQTFSGEVAGGGGLKLGGDDNGSMAFAGGKAQGKVELESRVALPAGVDPSSLLSDPVGTIRAAAVQMGESVQHKLTVGLDGQGNFLGNAGGLSAEVSFTGKPTEILRSGAVAKALGGDIEGALAAAGEGVPVEAKVVPYTQVGLSLSPGVSIMGFGVGLEVEATRRDVSDTPIWEYRGNAAQAARELHERAMLVPKGPAVPPMPLRG